MANGKILTAEINGVCLFKFVGDVRVTLCGTLDELVRSMLGNARAVIIDLTETVNIDSTSLGLLAKLAIHAQQQQHVQKPIIVCNDPDIQRILKSVSFDQIFILTEELAMESTDFTELTEVVLEQDDLRQCIIEAHKILMSMNESSKEQFQDLVSALEATT